MQQSCEEAGGMFVDIGKLGSDESNFARAGTTDRTRRRRRPSRRQRDAIAGRRPLGRDSKACGTQQIIGDPSLVGQAPPTIFLNRGRCPPNKTTPTPARRILGVILVGCAAHTTRQRFDVCPALDAGQPTGFALLVDYKAIT